MQLFSPAVLNKMDRIRYDIRFLLGIFLVSIWLSHAAEGKADVLKSDEICYSQECYSAVDTIKRNRKPGTDPCGDFYKYVCGGWQSRNPIPPDQSRWNQFTMVANITNYRIKGILEAGDKIDEMRSVKTARRFYRSCLATHANAEKNMQIFMENLSQWGGWPMINDEWEEEKFDWQNLLVNLERTTFDFSSLLSIIMAPDRKDSSTLVISIDQANLPFCPYLYTEDSQEAFAKLIAATAFKFAMVDKRTLSLEQLVEDTANMLNFTVQMCALQNSRKGRLDEFELYNPKTLKELQDITDEKEIKNSYSKINWLQIINNYLEGSVIRFTENELIIIRDIHYILQLMSIIDAAPQRVLANYMLFHKIANIQKYLSSEMLGFVNEFDQNTSGQMSNSGEWWTDCVEDTSSIFDHAVGYEYVKMYFGEQDKEKATELVRLILDSFIEDLKNNEWMDEETRTKAVEKAENILPVVGYPEWYTNTSRIDAIYSEIIIDDRPYFEQLTNVTLGILLYNAKLLLGNLDRSEFMLGPTVVNAGYFSTLNVMNIPAGMFQPPFYLKGRPEAINYGAIGTIIGHELNHAFDIQGRTGDRNGNLVNWWTPSTLEKYLKKAECFEKQYNDYPIPEISMEQEITHLDGATTISENMADNGGLIAAFQAYKKYIDRHGNEKRLPGLTSYTPYQLFFIGYSSIWCENRDDKFIVEDILTDDHTPFKYRVLITLGNSEEFLNAWSCHEGSEMNLATKCRLRWK